MSWKIDELESEISIAREVLEDETDGDKIAHALYCIASALVENAKATNLASWRLGTADGVAIGSPSGTMGALEFVGAQIKEAALTIAASIDYANSKG